MNKNDLTVNQVRRAAGGDVTVGHRRCDDHDNIGAVKSLRNIGGGQIHFAEPADGPADLNSPQGADGGNRLRENIV